MELVRLDKISLSFGTQVLFDMVDLSLKKGDKVGLLGRNGTGKTTLMKIIAGAVKPDSGNFWLRQGAEVAWLEQSLPNTDNQTVYEVVASGFAEIGELLARYHHLIANYDQDNSTELAEIQSQLDSRQGWSIEQKIDRIISQLGLPKRQMMSELSGGWRKKLR
jgi:ABC transport system ATP-binding/permease protein